MLEDVIKIAEAILGTKEDLPEWIDPADLVRWGVERCPGCGYWREGGTIQNERCSVCRGTYV